MISDYIENTGVFTTWQAVLEQVISAEKISYLKKEEILYNVILINVIRNNALNNVLISIFSSTSELIDYVHETKNMKVNSFLVLLIVSACAALISTTVLLTVVRKIKKSKEEILLLFMLLTDPEIENYQAKCKSFAHSCIVIILI